MFKLSRASDRTHTSSIETILMLVTWSCLEYVRNDISVGKDVSKYELESVRSAIRSTVGCQVRNDSAVSTGQMNKVSSITSPTDDSLSARDDR